MSSIVLQVILFVCAFIHACNARYHVGIVHEKAYHFVEVGEKSMGNDNEELKIGKDGRLTDYIRGYADKVKESYLKSLAKEALEEVAGSSDHRNEKIVVVQGIKQEFKVKGWKRRLMLTITRPQDNEEMVNSKGEEEAGTDEDIVDMDYAQPHRKPPIHNEEN